MGVGPYPRFWPGWTAQPLRRRTLDSGGSCSAWLPRHRVKVREEEEVTRGSGVLSSQWGGSKGLPGQGALGGRAECWRAPDRPSGGKSPPPSIPRMPSPAPVVAQTRHGGMSYPRRGFPGTQLAEGGSAQLRDREGRGRAPMEGPCPPPRHSSSQGRPIAQTLLRSKTRATRRSALRTAIMRRNIAYPPQASLNWPTEGWRRNKPHLEPTREPRAPLS